MNKYVVMFRKVKEPSDYINPLNDELNPTCHLLALLGAHHIFHVSGLRVKCEKCLDWTGNYQLFKKGSAHSLVSQLVGLLV